MRIFSILVYASVPMVSTGLFFQIFIIQLSFLPFGLPLLKLFLTFFALEKFLNGG